MSRTGTTILKMPSSLTLAISILCFAPTPSLADTYYGYRRSTTSRIIGAVIGVVILLMIIALIVWEKKRRARRAAMFRQGVVNGPGYVPPGGQGAYGMGKPVGQNQSYFSPPQQTPYGQGGYGQAEYGQAGYGQGGYGQQQAFSPPSGPPPGQYAPPAGPPPPNMPPPAYVGDKSTTNAPSNTAPNEGQGGFFGRFRS